ncbi:MAG: 16S rRNA (adenine(1518)-N(6)/adenine(1519)-N(6))-dimethyltransferase RsmA [Verrucomicrobiia bacterium]
MTPTETRAALERLALQPSKAMGQNFLVDRNIAYLIVDAAGLHSEDTVLEIGPGLGALTELMLEHVARVVAVEKDGRLCEFLRERFGQRQQLQLIHADALEFDFVPVAPFKVVANLPYAVATPLLQRLVDSPARPRRMVLTVQREVADRLVAKPRTKDYGALTLFTQLYYEVRREHIISPRCFIPPPAIDSAVVSLRLAPHPLLEPAFEAPFKEYVRAGFGQRRKMLRGVLPKSTTRVAVTVDQVEAALKRVGVLPTARGEELSLAQWLLLTRELVAPAPAEPKQP